MLERRAALILIAGGLTPHTQRKQTNSGDGEEQETTVIGKVCVDEQFWARSCRASCMEAGSSASIRAAGVAV